MRVDPCFIKLQPRVIRLYGQGKFGLDYAIGINFNPVFPVV